MQIHIVVDCWNLLEYKKYLNLNNFMVIPD